ncbi:MAG: phosphate acyltransferase PlsX [Planctomycetota bacterium]
MIRIAVDAMGGDHAPREVVRGAVEANRLYPDCHIILVGDREAVERELASAAPSDRSRLEIHHASQIIGMDESPVEGLRRKPDASIRVAADLVKEGRADALVSAGNTGAVVAAAMMRLGLLPGVRRPGIAVAFPTEKGGICVMIDVGANIYCKPLHLLQYGLMAQVFAGEVLGLPNPSVGLLNIGEETGKGNDLVRRTFHLFERSPFHFQGNVEGRDVFKGTCDIVVCEGFVGNVVLKVAEGLSEVIFKVVRKNIGKNLRTKVGGWLCRPAFQAVRDSLDSSEYGGAPLLGVSGGVIIAHGSTEAHGIRHAIRVGGEFAQHRVNDRIVTALANFHFARPVA